jgi:hypothetical protein
MQPRWKASSAAHAEPQGERGEGFCRERERDGETEREAQRETHTIRESEAKMSEGEAHLPHAAALEGGEQRRARGAAEPAEVRRPH